VILEIELQARISNHIKNTKNSADFQSISGSSDFAAGLIIGHTVFQIRLT